MFYSGFTVLLAIELLQFKRESTIDKSKILTDSAKDKLCTLSIAAESLFGGQVAEIQKLNSESQQLTFIASHFGRGIKSAIYEFRIPKRPPKKPDTRGSSLSRPPKQRKRSG